MCAGLIVCKFGGTSVKNAEAFARVGEIIAENADRRVITVSAPGKRFEGDIKITDRLAECHALAAAGRPFSDKFEGVREVFSDIARALSLGSVSEELDAIARGMVISRDWAVSRGEELCAKLMAKYIDRPYVGAERLFVFERGMLCEDETYARLNSLPRKGAVIPGFYGADRRGNVVTFPRGGSDITGAYAAAALRADLYENMTDVDGFYAIDPRLVPRAEPIPEMSYRQARALCEMGACVLHLDCVPPVEARGIPIRVKSTFKKGGKGTLIGANLRCKCARAAAAVYGDKCRISIMGADAESLRALERYAKVEYLTGCAAVECPKEMLKELADTVYSVCVERRY